jgi:hypothetical protein
MRHRKCPSCFGTGNLGLCRPCKGAGYFEFDSIEVKSDLTKSIGEISSDLDDVLCNIETALCDKRLVAMTNRNFYANKAAKLIIKEIIEFRDLKTESPTLEFSEALLLRARKFCDELNSLINGNDSIQKPGKSKKTSKSDPRQQTLF